MEETYTSRIYRQIAKEIVARYLVGSEKFSELCLMSYLARGHVLVEGPPGTGKTLAAKLFARVLSKSFNRIQFTSDLLPADIIGAHIYSPAEKQFNFLQGPLFADFILADEINRTPPRTQSALLEAMEERQVTSEGHKFTLSPDFFVIATQNPREFEGTFSLPEAQIDRFTCKVDVHHANADEEISVLNKIITGVLPPRLDDVPQVEIDRPQIDAEIASTTIDQSLVTAVTRILQATRSHAQVQMGTSIRGGIALVTCSRVLALIRGRKFVIPDDIKELAPAILSHRIRLTPEAYVSGVKEEQVLQDVIARIPFPD